MSHMNRRQALARLGMLSTAAALLPIEQMLGGEHGSAAALPLDVPTDVDSFPWTEIGRQLRQRFPALHRHFIFEYYPWYKDRTGGHWWQWDRTPPVDIAATSYPRLGPYDSADTRVIEKHARWIVKSGVGAVNLSWWGRDSFTNEVVHKVMDVMADHDIKVTFHLEPYSDRRVYSYPDDIAYLVREYGDRRGWDCFLLLPDAQGRVGPVLKGFRTTVKSSFIDCNGNEVFVTDYASDDVWHRQNDRARDELRNAFDHVTLLTSSVNIRRVAEAGFDGFALYSNTRDPVTWNEKATGATDRDLLFSFNCNPGFDSIARRNVPPGSCYVPPSFVPPTTPINWRRQVERERARTLAEERIIQTMAATLLLQWSPDLNNNRRGFFLVYVNSFNEWHEGHAFEPAANYGSLTPDQRAVGYHNPKKGNYRLALLRRIMRRILR